MEKSIRLINAVLDKLSADKEFAESLKNSSNKEQVIKDLIGKLHNEGYNVITSKADMQAIAAIDIDKFIAGCRSGEGHPEAEPLC